MKFLKFRYIFTLAIVLALGITLTVYFFGGIRTTALENQNLEFDYEGFIDYSSFDADGNSIVLFGSEIELQNAVKNLNPASYEITIDEAKKLYQVKYKLSEDRIVAQNEKFTMFLDEKTTIITVVVNDTCDAYVGETYDGFKNYKQNTCKTSYSTAIKNDLQNEAKANFSLKYVGSNGKISSLGFNTFTNSVLYDDLLLGKKTRHYKIRFNEEDGIDILYEIGDFTVINSFFPKKYNRETFLDMYRGNLAFAIDSTKLINEDKYVYSLGYTWSAECAAYIEENELATVTPVYNNNSFRDEDGNQIPARWNLTDILEKDDEGRTLNSLKMKLGVDYNSPDVNAEGASPCVANPFANTFIFSALFNSFYKLSTVDENDENIKYSGDYTLNLTNTSPTFVLHAQGSTQFQKMYDYLYKVNSDTDPNYFYEIMETVGEANKDKYPNNKIGDKVKRYVLYDENPYDDIPGVPVPLGGFHARDEDGNFLYDEDGKPVQQVLTIDEANLQNSLHGLEVESIPPIFQVGIRFKLTDQGLDATIINNSIIEGMGKNYREDGKKTKYSHDLKIVTMDFLPYLTSNNSLTSVGQIIIPDGSGAVISFNSAKDKLGYTAHSKPIYGLDKAFTFTDNREVLRNEKIMFGMFGFLDKTQEKGILAIADRGAAQTSIYANFKREELTNSRNIAYFQPLFRESETVYAGTAKTPFLKWSKERSQTDFAYKYQFLSPIEFIDGDGNIQYVTLAKKYRDYLMDKYDLVNKKNIDETDYNVVALNFLGSFEKREVTLGFSHQVEHSLTTFAQAQAIIEELQNEGVQHFVASYTAWTKDAMEPRATSKVSISKALGSSKGIKSFAQFLVENEINFYPEIRVATNKGYDYSFGNLKYTAKGVGSTYAQHYDYNLSTGQINSGVSPSNMLSPIYYQDYLRNYLKSYDKFGIASGYISDLGNLRMGDYARSRVTYAVKGQDYQISALEYASQSLNSMMLSAPYDYALKYTDFAINVPLESSLLGYYDYSIPFYQLVVSGLFDYAGPAVNFDSEHSPNWYLLKALETGSNLHFMISAEDPKVLLDTNYTMYYNTYYANWKNEIISMNSIINSLGLHNGSTLVSHKILSDNVYRVTYSNGLELVINQTNLLYHDNKTGLSVRPNSFVVLKEAK